MWGNMMGGQNRGWGVMGFGMVGMVFSVRPQDRRRRTPSAVAQGTITGQARAVCAKSANACLAVDVRFTHGKP